MSKSLVGQLVSYVIVGGVGYLLAIAVYAAVLWVGVKPYAAVVAVFVLNGAFNFLLLRRWTFPPTGRRTRSELLRFSVVALVSLAANYASFAALYSLAGITALPAQAVAIILAAPVGFVANRYWSFKAEAPSAA